MTATEPPLLVTGMPRTGTSWVGKMLEAGGEVVYVNEPLNPGHPPGHSPGVLDATVTHQFQYVDPEDDGDWHAAFARTLALRYGFVREVRRNHKPYDLARMLKYGTSFTLGRWRGRHAMLDDPFAIFCVPWLVRTFGVRAVVLVRDPVSLVGSYTKMAWKMRFDQILDQPALLRDLIGPAVHDLHVAAKETDPVRAAAMMWRAVYGVVDRNYRALPGVTIRRYEDLASNPVEEFHDLYDYLGLRWRRRAEKTVTAATTGTGSDEASHRWTLRFGLSKTAFRPMDSSAALRSAQDRLTPEQIATVRELTRDLTSRFYDTSPTPPPLAARRRPRRNGVDPDADAPKPPRVVTPPVPDTPTGRIYTAPISPAPVDHAPVN
jgi:hypothetical protein